MRQELPTLWSRLNFGKSEEENRRMRRPFRNWYPMGFLLADVMAAAFGFGAGGAV